MAKKMTRSTALTLAITAINYIDKNVKTHNPSDVAMVQRMIEARDILRNMNAQLTKKKEG